MAYNFTFTHIMRRISDNILYNGVLYVSYDFISDGVCVLDCVTLPGTITPFKNVCNGKCYECLMYLEYKRSEYAV